MSAADSTDLSGRDAILAMLEDAMVDIHQRLVTADASVDEDLQLKRARTLGYLANQYRKLHRDIDLDEMEEELALLKAEEDADT